MPAQTLTRLPSRQQGVILVTVLVFLVLLTLISLTGMRAATMEERMSGNSRDRDIAFQAAEAALRTAEDYLVANAGLGEADFDDDPTSTTASGHPGLIGQVVPDSTTDEPGRARYWRNYNWAVHSQSYPADIQNTSERPRYVIELLGSTGTVSRISGPRPEPNTYRITARGVGMSGSAVVYLQSTFIKN